MGVMRGQPGEFLLSKPNAATKSSSLEILSNLRLQSALFSHVLNKFTVFLWVFRTCGSRY